MASLQQIETAAQGIIEICRKDKTTKANKEQLLKLQAEIFTSIESLVECERCGSITDVIAEITINQITAKLCQTCGIKVLETGKIEKKPARRRTRRTQKKKSVATDTPKAAPTAEEEQPSQSQANPLDLYTKVEEETRLKKTDIKRLHKMIEDIAAPMNLEHTISYVQREAENAKLKIKPDTLPKAVELLMAG